MLSIRICLLGLAAPFLLPAGLAQQASPARTPQGVLGEMAAQAGVIFAGQVLSVTRAEAAGYVQITFRVETPVRNAPAAGGTYTLREWSGLWAGGGERYTPGQRLLLLLTEPATAGGLSAPVRGQDGMVPLVAGVQPPLLDAAGNAPAEAPGVSAELHVDLRWLAARALRTPSTSGRPTPVRSPALPPVLGPGEWLGPFTVLSESEATAASINPALQPPLSSVLALLVSAAPVAGVSAHAGR